MEFFARRPLRHGDQGRQFGPVVLHRGRVDPELDRHPRHRRGRRRWGDSLRFGNFKASPVRRRSPSAPTGRTTARERSPSSTARRPGSPAPAQRLRSRQPRRPRHRRERRHVRQLLHRLTVPGAAAERPPPAQTGAAGITPPTYDLMSRPTTTRGRPERIALAARASAWSSTTSRHSRFRRYYT